MWQVRRSDGTIAPGWYLLPLRLFLGATFLFAGIQKLANPTFFRASNPTGIHAQLAQAASSSPISGVVSHLVGASSTLGYLIAIGEVAIGLGTLVGLWSRVAAGAGMLLSFGLFLTVSFHSAPYYTGSDIVFLFAWTPVLLAGAAGAPALDTVLAAGDAWSAGAGVAADESDPTDGAAGDRPGAVSRGAVLGGAVLATAAVSAVAVGLGRAGGGTDDEAGADEATTTEPSASTTTTTTTTPLASGPSGTGTSTTTTTAPHGKEVAAAGQVPVGGSATFTDPTSGDPGLVLQPKRGTFVAFDAVCPHEGCTVAYQSSADLIVCPCHGSEFNPSTGSLVRGPAPHGLSTIKITEGTDGTVYLA